MESVEERMARAERLQNARRGRGFESASAAADHFGWAKPTYIAHENGSRGIPRSKLLDYARAFRVSANHLLTGAVGPDVITITESAPVVGEVGAGLWREADIWDTAKYDDVPKTPGRFGGIPQSAYKVIGPSVDKLRIFDGDFVITVPYAEARAAPQDGDIVVVCRRHGALSEYTVKQVEIAPGAPMRLWPRSTDPRFQEPIDVPSGDSGSESHEVSIVALVIGAYRPM